jgi:formamidopyrimidine-DNA glycosylase
MPELPDVEVVRLRLDGVLRGATVTAAASKDRRILRPGAPAGFGRALVGRKVSEVARRGKWLRLALGDGGRLFCHLGMTGWWVEREPEAAAERTERARIDVRRGRARRSVRYLDGRRFGRLVVARDDIPEWRALGPDPLADGIDVDRLAELLARSRRPVKDTLMDQGVLAGIGNILATEALWHARLDPRTPGKTLSHAEVVRVARGLGTALRHEMKVRLGAKDDEWRDVFAVYGHAGAPCPRCRTPIERVVLSGRGTTFCPTCQPERA